MVEAGNSFGHPKRVEGAELEQRRRKASLIAEAWRLGGIDAVAVGANDWQLGRTVIFDLGAQLPLLAANLTCGDTNPFPPSVVEQRGGHTIGVVGLTAGEVSGCEVSDPVAAATAAVAQLPEEVDFTVILAPLSHQAVQSLAAAGLADLVVDGASGRRRKAPESTGASYVASLGSRSKYLGVLEVQFVEGATGFVLGNEDQHAREAVNRIADRLETARSRVRTASKPADLKRAVEIVAHYEQQLAEAEKKLDEIRSKQGGANVIDARQVELSRDIEDEPRTAQLVGDVKELVTGAPVAAAASGPRLAPAGSPFAGADTCRGCHPSEYAQWSTTGHGHAWQTLVKERRQLDHDCYGCHATGVGTAGGPTAPVEVAGLRDVQCEACHGAAREHLRDPAAHKPLADPAEALCVVCHDGDQDGGRFDFETYRPKIVHDAVPTGKKK